MYFAKLVPFERKFYFDIEWEVITYLKVYVCYFMGT